MAISRYASVGKETQERVSEHNRNYWDQRHLKLLLNEIAEALLIFDENGQLKDFNRPAARLFGIESTEEADALAQQEIISYFSNLFNDWENSFRNQPDTAIILPANTLTGTKRRVEIRRVKFETPSQSTINYLIVERDDQKVKSTFQKVIDSLPIAFAIFNNKNDQLEVSNYHFHHLFGEIKFSAFEKKLSLRNKSNIDSDALLVGYPVSLEKGGEAHHLLVYSQPVAGKEGHFVQYLLTDFGYHYQQMKDLQEKTLELEAFLYKTSHNLKGPTSSILGLVQLAKNEVRDEKAIVYFDLLEKGINQMEATIQELLQVARVKQNTLKKDEVWLKPLLREVIEGMKFMPGSESINIRLDIEQETPLISDTSLLHSVFTNLVENAIKYSKKTKGSSIDIRSRESNQGMEIEVEDNGIGIQRDMIPQIFDMFFRATDKSKGTGLGLYLVRQAIKRLKGQIEVSSELHTGTRFTIRLPLKIDD